MRSAEVIDTADVPFPGAGAPSGGTVQTPTPMSQSIVALGVGTVQGQRPDVKGNARDVSKVWSSMNFRWSGSGATRSRFSRPLAFSITLSQPGQSQSKNCPTTFGLREPGPVNNQNPLRYALLSPNIRINCSMWNARALAPLASRPHGWQFRLC